MKNYICRSQGHCNEIFDKYRNIIGDMINHFLQRTGNKKFYVYDGRTTSIEYLYPSISSVSIRNIRDLPKGHLCYFETEQLIEVENFFDHYSSYHLDDDFIVFCKKPEISEKLDWIGEFHTLDQYGISGGVYLFGKTFSCKRDKIPEDFRVLAMIHCYNEADVIRTTLEHLIKEEIDCYVIDNWSTDGSYEIVTECIEKYPGKIQLERFPIEGKNDFFDWYHQLERTEQLSYNEDYSWFMHYDADEIHISPWKDVSLRRAIYHFDQLGYNTIDNTVIVFKLTRENSNENIYAKETWFDYGHSRLDFEQRKTWKKASLVDLKKSGGHIAEITNNKTSPINLLNCHYPLRSIIQAERKVFRDRKPRFGKEQKERGWHGHYNRMQSSEDFLSDKNTLLMWDEDAYDKYYVSSFLACGIRCDQYETMEILHFLYGKRIAIYGAGKVGTKVFLHLFDKCNIVLWVDRNYEKLRNCFYLDIHSPDEVKQKDFDLCIIANANSYVQEEMSQKLLDMGIEKKKIIFYPEQ